MENQEFDRPNYKNCIIGGQMEVEKLTIRGKCFMMLRIVFYVDGFFLELFEIFKIRKSVMGIKMCVLDFIFGPIQILHNASNGGQPSSIRSK